LAAQRKFDFDALLDFPAGLICKPEQCPGNPALHLLACEFNHACVRVLKAAPDSAKGIRRKFGISAREGSPLR
jgi:hypothetical protein